MYNSKNEMFVKVIEDSVTEHGKRIVTFHAHYPRIIHSEVMTHRVFSRNARSSRAVPVKTIIQEVIDKPFIPWHFGKNQKGMQATEECNEILVFHDPEGNGMSWQADRESAWLWGRDQAVQLASAYNNVGYHKQVINRILEPYSWIDTLITTTDLSNFYHLRDHEDAEPHFHDLAKLVREAVDASTPKVLQEEEWHIPFVTEDEIETLDIDTLLKLSVARSARISYAPFDGNPSIERELERYELLVGSEPLHASPAEHQAQVDIQEKTSIDGVFYTYRFQNPTMGGNLGPGFIQYRKTLPNECFHGKW